MRIQTELGKHLAAGPHGEPPLSVTTAITSNSMLAFGDGLEHGHALGANAGWIGGILDVHAGVDAAALRPQRRADPVIGIRRIRMDALPRWQARSVSAIFFVVDGHAASFE